VNLYDFALFGAIVNGLVVQPFWLFLWLKDRNKKDVS